MTEIPKTPPKTGTKAKSALEAPEFQTSFAALLGNIGRMKPSLDVIRLFKQRGWLPQHVKLPKVPEELIAMLDNLFLTGMALKEIKVDFEESRDNERQRMIAASNQVHSYSPSRFAKPENSAEMKRITQDAEKLALSNLISTIERLEIEKYLSQTVAMMSHKKNYVQFLESTRIVLDEILSLTRVCLNYFYEPIPNPKPVMSALRNSETKDSGDLSDLIAHLEKQTAELPTRAEITSAESTEISDNKKVDLSRFRLREDKDRQRGARADIAYAAVMERIDGLLKRYVLLLKASGADVSYFEEQR